MLRNQVFTAENGVLPLAAKVLSNMFETEFYCMVNEMPRQLLPWEQDA